MHPREHTGAPSLLQQLDLPVQCFCGFVCMLSVSPKSWWGDQSSCQGPRTALSVHRLYLIKSSWHSWDTGLFIILVWGDCFSSVLKILNGATSPVLFTFFIWRQGLTQLLMRICSPSCLSLPECGDCRHAPPHPAEFGEIKAHNVMFHHVCVADQ